MVAHSITVVILMGTDSIAPSLLFLVLVLELLSISEGSVFPDYFECSCKFHI